MNYGWGVLSLGAVAGEAFRDYPAPFLLEARAIAPRVTGHTFSDLPSVALLEARGVGPQTIIVVGDYPPNILLATRAPGPRTYVRIDEYPPTIFAGVSLSSPTDSEISLLAPRAIFYGYEFDGTNLSIPIADLIGLTAEEADAVTGDWREVLQAILLTATEYHRSFQWSIQPRTYNAFGMNLLHTQTFDRHFGITFYTNMGEPNVAPEP